VLIPLGGWCALDDRSRPIDYVLLALPSELNT
jgi:hypothetical protein